MQSEPRDFFIATKLLQNFAKFHFGDSGWEHQPTLQNMEGKWSGVMETYESSARTSVARGPIRFKAEKRRRVFCRGGAVSGCGLRGLPVYFQLTSSRWRCGSLGICFLIHDQQWTCWSVGEMMKKLQRTEHWQSCSSFKESWNEL